MYTYVFILFSILKMMNIDHFKIQDVQILPTYTNFSRKNNLRSVYFFYRHLAINHFLFDLRL